MFSGTPDVREGGGGGEGGGQYETATIRSNINYDKHSASGWGFHSACSGLSDVREVGRRG